MTCRLPGATRWMGAVLIGTACGLLAVPAAAQAPEGWTPPRTADGKVDLQGIWANNRATPMQRPEQLGNKATLSDEELAELTQLIAEFRDSEQAGDLLGDRLIQQALGNSTFQDFDAETGNYNAFWLVDRQLDNRTSLIIDPPNGRRPALTEAARTRARERAAARGDRGPSDGPEDRTLGDRCLHFSQPNMGSGYNSYFQLFQTPTQVTIIQEMGHLVRNIPLDGRPHLGDQIPQWGGNARGRWEGDTLVVETRNWRNGFSGGSSNMVLTERFTRVGPRTLRQELTMTDPDTWESPWTVELLLDESDQPIFEYACHEGNYAMEGILGGARYEEREAGQ